MSRVVLLLLFAAPTAEAADKPAEIAGTYQCRGQNPQGAAYVGVTKITKTGDTYHLDWAVGEEKYRGVAIRSGNHLSVAFPAGNTAGVVAYTIKMVNGKLTLVGKWTAVGGTKVYSETLTRQ